MNGRLEKNTKFNHMQDATLENVCSKSMEWSVPMWYASLDLRKAFDRIDYNALFDALKVQGVPFAYLKFLPSLYHMYHDQVGFVQGRQFPIKSGVKQGDVLSPLLFTAGFEHAIKKWKFRVQHCGFFRKISVLDCCTGQSPGNAMIVLLVSLQATKEGWPNPNQCF